MMENSGPMATRRLSSGRSWQQAERKPRNRYAQTGKGARQLGRPGKKTGRVGHTGQKVFAENSNGRQLGRDPSFSGRSFQ